MRKVVGSIDGYDVIYVEGKNVIFCKNTALPYPLIKVLLGEVNVEPQLMIRILPSLKMVQLFN